MAVTRSTIYANVNFGRPKEYWNHENYVVEWRGPEGYELICKIGTGKFSEVYEALDTENNNTMCVVKVLKPISQMKVKREVKILETVRGGTNIITLQATVMDPASKSLSLVFEYVNNNSFEQLYPTLGDFDVRYFMYELLKALDYCHRVGIMHLDIKPANVVIDYINKKLRLIDFGSSEFYRPEMEYHTRVGTLCYQAPEMLVKYVMYNYSVDMWSFGCILAAIIFKKEPFFKGKTSLHQLISITEILGTVRFREFLKKYHIKICDNYNRSIGSKKRKFWKCFINKGNSDLASTNVFDLLDKLLCYDHLERFSARRAMKHSYFRFIRNIHYPRLKKCKPSASATKPESGNNTLSASTCEGALDNVESLVCTSSAMSYYGDPSTLSIKVEPENGGILELDTKAALSNDEPLVFGTSAMPGNGELSKSSTKLAYEHDGTSAPT